MLMPFVFPAALGAGHDERSIRPRRLPSDVSNERTTILIVDDNPEFVAATAELLEHDGYAALRACSAREAVDLLDEINCVDLVLSDVRMPDVDGFDLLRILRHRFPSLPIILMTGLPVTSQDVVPRDAVILRKPVDALQLRNAMRRKLLASGK